MLFLPGRRVLRLCLCLCCRWCSVGAWRPTTCMISQNCCSRRDLRSSSSARLTYKSNSAITRRKICAAPPPQGFELMMPSKKTKLVPASRPLAHFHSSTLLRPTGCSLAGQPAKPPHHLVGRSEPSVFYCFFCCAAAGAKQSARSHAEPHCGHNKNKKPVFLPVSSAVLLLLYTVTKAKHAEPHCGHNKRSQPSSSKTSPTHS